MWWVFVPPPHVSLSIFSVIYLHPPTQRETIQVHSAVSEVTKVSCNKAVLTWWPAAKLRSYFLLKRCEQPPEWVQTWPCFSLKYFFFPCTFLKFSCPIWLLGILLTGCHLTFLAMTVKLINHASLHACSLNRLSIPALVSTEFPSILTGNIWTQGMKILHFACCTNQLTVHPLRVLYVQPLASCVLLT